MFVQGPQYESVPFPSSRRRRRRRRLRRRLRRRRRRRRSSSSRSSGRKTTALAAAADRIIFLVIFAVVDIVGWFFSWRITSDGLPHAQEKSVPVRTRPVVQNRILPLESFFLLSYLLSPFPPPSSPSLFTGGRGGGSRRRRRCRRRRLRRRRAPREKIFSIIAGVPVRQ